MKPKIPHFQYNLSNPQLDSYRCIVAGHDVVHQITDVNDFYAQFGYTPFMKKAGVLPDEFIWSEYIKDGAVGFVGCVQMQVKSKICCKFGLAMTAFSAC